MSSQDGRRVDAWPPDSADSMVSQTKNGNLQAMATTPLARFHTSIVDTEPIDATEQVRQRGQSLPQFVASQRRNADEQPA